jgi:glycosyltransferase involved in cell wall biosynthesis
MTEPVAGPPGRLLLVSETLTGGMGSDVLAEADWFRGEGWDVRVAAPAADLTRGRPDVALQTMPVTLRDVRRVASTAAVLRRARSRWNPDVVHCHGPRGFVIARLSGAPRPVVTLHGTGSMPSDPRGWSTLRRMGMTVLPHLATRAYTVFPDFHRSWVFLPHASPNLSSLEVLPFASRDSTPTFLWLGRLDEPKQPEILVRALAEVGRNRPVRGVVAGTGERSASLRTLADELGVDLTLTGHRTDLAPLLQEAWAVTLFSRYEGIPFALQEAMWAGRPVIATPHPGVRWLVGEAGVYASTVPDAAAAMLRLTDWQTASSAGERAARRVRQLMEPNAPWPELETQFASMVASNRAART